MIFLFLEEPKVIPKLSPHLFLNLREDLFALIPLCKDCYELPVINNPKAKRIATLILMNEFDYIVREAREIFVFYNMSHENPMINEILYNEFYLLRYLFCDNHTFNENTKK